eukprot:scaffold154417_cov49-Prasinocladus_malaysianus.AAC.5
MFQLRPEPLQQPSDQQQSMNWDCAPELKDIVFSMASPAQALGAGVCRLLESCRNIFAALPESLASSLQLTSWATLNQCTEGDAAPVCCIKSAGEGQPSEVSIFLAAASKADPQGSVCSLICTSLAMEPGIEDSAWGCLGIISPQSSRSCSTFSRRISFRGPPGTVVADAQFYKENKIVLLLADAAEQSGKSTLAMADYGHLDADWQGQSLSTLQKHEAAVRDLPDEALRMRCISTGCHGIPIGVSGPRGVACLYTSLQRLLVMDLEEDEEEDEGDEEEEGQGDEDEEGS